MYKKAMISIFLVLFIAIAGCNYEYQPYGSEVQCEPPAQKMTDISGNTVCVVPSADINNPAEAVVPEDKAAEEASQDAESADSSKEAEEKAEAEPSEKTGTKEETEIKEDETKEEKKETSESLADESIKDLPKKVVKEGELVSFPNLKAVDPDGDKVTYTFSEPLNDKGEWQTKEGDAGTYVVTITASDGKNKVEKKVAIIVESGNRPPVITLRDSISIKEGQTLKIVPEVKDPDGDKVTVTFSGWMDSDTYKTNFDDAGEHTVKVTASDGKNKVTKEIKIIVEDVNRPPVIAKIEPITVTEGELAEIKVDAKDPDGDKLEISFSDPFDSEGKWQTKEGDAGQYSIDVSASDGSLNDIESVLVTVKSLNKPPVITGVEDMTVKEGETVTLNPEVTDPEGDKVTVTYSGWMTSNTKKVGYDEQGEHKVTIKATDGVNTATKKITVTVEDVNRPPEFVGLI